jgi:D-3-phosphoglycerate dehydrogenase
VKVLVAEAIAPAGVALLQKEHSVDLRTDLTREQLLAALPAYEALIVRSQVKVDATAIEIARRLRVIARAGVGVDNIDVAAATSAGITVVNAPTANTIAAAELTVGLMYALARHIPAADASLRRGEWQRSKFMGHELRGRTLGIVGLGKIGLAVAGRALAMEMRLIASDPYVEPAAAAAHGVELMELDRLLATADVVTLHVPLNDQTRALIGDSQLARMKPDALLVNVARGGLVDEAALAAALRDGRLAGAAVDVYEHEPPHDSPLLGAPNLVLTPHLGASTTEAQERAGVEVAEQVLEVLAGRPARYAVNRPAEGAASRH